MTHSTKLNSSTWSLYEAVEALREPIDLAVARGYTYEEIAELLSAHGIRLSAFEIKNYLRRFKQDVSTQEAQADTAISVEDDPIWEMGKNPIQIGISDLSENHDIYLYSLY